MARNFGPDSAAEAELYAWAYLKQVAEEEAFEFEERFCPGDPPERERHEELYDYMESDERHWIGRYDLEGRCG